MTETQHQPNGRKFDASFLEAASQREFTTKVMSDGTSVNILHLTVLEARNLFVSDRDLKKTEIAERGDKLFAKCIVDDDCQPVGTPDQWRKIKQTTASELQKLIIEVNQLNKEAAEEEGKG